MKKIYTTILNYIRSSKPRETIMRAICKYLPYLTFIIYAFVLIYLLLTYQSHQTILLTVIVRPVTAFLIVTILRKIINRPRPYETLHFEPLVSHKKGESFPSRHSVSAMIIALVCFDVNFYLGIVTLIIAIMICLSRLIAGVHYISDVLAAIAIALIVYFI